MQQEEEDEEEDDEQHWVQVGGQHGDDDEDEDEQQRVGLQQLLPDFHQPLPMATEIKIITTMIKARASAAHAHLCCMYESISE